jgi:UDP-N-acetylmuramoyl-tripeptide--D-alanyl-D-alanine ligase
MIRANLIDAARAVDGNLVGDDVPFAGVSIDTRTLAAGNLFVALRGERVDGHAYLAAAAAAGAAGALVERPDPAAALPQIVVTDTQHALGRLGAWWRARLGARVVAVTGSNGKTTVKTMLAAVLACAGRTQATVGNLNNEIGLPLSVLALDLDTDFAVLEMGCGQPGDIAYLVDIARPQVALVNNAGPAHLERLGSVAGVARAKSEIYGRLPADGVGIYNADDANAAVFAAAIDGHARVSFGIDAGADVHADIEALTPHARFRLHTPAGSADVVLPMPGRHNVMNALAAAACAVALGVDAATISRGLAAVPPVAGRLVARTMPGGWVLIDDSYNANPASTEAGIAATAAGGARVWLVLGDMRELGDEAAALHAEVGRRARAHGVERVYATGALSAHAVEAFGAGGRWFETQDALAGTLGADITGGVHVLVKGSRGSRMDKVVAALATRGEGAHAV